MPIPPQPISPESLTGLKILRVLQTPSKNTGVILEEFGEAYRISLVIALSNGSFAEVGEYDIYVYTGDTTSLIPAELVQGEYSLCDLENQSIIGIQEEDDDNFFGILLENGLAFHCPYEPGGNFPWIWNTRSPEE